MDNTLKPIEDFITSGLAERFYKVFGIPLLFYNGQDVKTVANKQLKDRGLPSYPYARAKFVNLAISENTWKPNTLMRRGLKSRASSDGLLAYELNLAPVSTTYQVTFYVQDMQSVRRLAKNWMFAYLRNNLKFSITYAVADLDIDIDMDREMPIPDKPGGTTEVKEYEIEVQMIVHGFMSEELKTTQAVSEIDMEIQILAEMGLKGGKVEIFRKDWPQAQAGNDASVVTDKNFVYLQKVPSSLWTVIHGLGKYPAVTVLDDDGSLVEASVHFPSLNVVVISFGMAVTGTAFFN